MGVAHWSIIGFISFTWFVIYDFGLVRFWIKFDWILALKAGNINYNYFKTKQMNILKNNSKDIIVNTIVYTIVTSIFDNT